MASEQNSSLVSRRTSLSQIEPSLLKVIRLSPKEVKGESDYASLFRKQVLEHDFMYPGIDKWYNKKVIPGILNGERAGFLCLYNDVPVISAVVKKGSLSKFCHLHISKEFQDSHLGEVFFCMMAAEVRHFSNNVHFTLPESLWIHKKEFFKSFSFSNATLAYDQYRLFEREYECQTTFENLWKSVLGKIPKLITEFASQDSIINGLLLSIRPEFAEKILRGEKVVELRRKFNARHIGQKAAIYSSRPVQAIVGEALISNVEQNSPASIWEKYSNALGCTKQEFDAYTETYNQVYAVILDEVRPYPVHYSLIQMEHLTGETLKPPQSYCSVEGSQGWAKALTITEFLQGRFSIGAGTF